MRFPTIHNNGTPAQTLLEQVEKAGGSLRLTINALHEMRPHGRDYYTQGDNALTEAQNEHRDRINALERVYAKLGEIHEHIQDRIDEIEKQKRSR